MKIFQYYSLPTTTPSPVPLPKKEEANVSSMPSADENDDKEGVVSPGIYVIATWTKL